MTREEMRTNPQYTGLDNYKHPRREFLDKIEQQDDVTFQKTTEQYIWLSAFAGNNPRSDYHWQCDACYDEAQVRGKPEIYTRAYKQVARPESY